MNKIIKLDFFSFYFIILKNLTDMKRFILLLIIISGFQFNSFGQEKDSIKCTSYEYMTIIGNCFGYKLQNVFITMPGGEVEQYIGDKLDWNYKNFDTTFIIDLLEKYSKSGWIVQNSNITADNALNYYFLLKREKKI